MFSYRTIGILGLLTVIFSLVLTLYFPKEVAEMPEGFKTPILAFEFIHSGEEFKQMVGETPLIFDFANKLDFGFPLFYASFLGLFALNLAKFSKLKICHLCAYLGFLSMPFDWVENYFLLEISGSFEGIYTSDIFGLQVFTWLKWFSISFCLAGIAYVLYEKLYKRLAPFILISPLIMSLLAFFDRGVFNELMALLIGLSYIVLIILSFHFYKNPLENKVEQL